MTVTALLLILPVVATVVFGVIARAATGRMIPMREAAISARPVIVKPLPAVKPEDHRQRPVARAA